ncbi:MAG: hypothetical protein ACRD7E_30455, partial [Bryobacteraceae bacterium]
ELAREYAAKRSWVRTIFSVPNVYLMKNVRRSEPDCSGRMDYFRQRYQLNAAVVMIDSRTKLLLPQGQHLKIRSVLAARSDACHRQRTNDRLRLGPDVSF